ncbi:hypothetical protein ScPMuIL_013482 [Solemya velum]
MITVLKTFTFIVLVAVVATQNPCDPMDDGPIPPVAPTLYLSITEATQEDLMQHPHSEEYQDEIRLHGSLNAASPGAITLESTNDYSSVNPSDYFVFDTDLSGQKNIIRLAQPFNRDGATAQITDDTNIVSFTLRCTPQSNTTAARFYQVSLLIRDVNDNPPVFLQTPHIRINELTPTGQLIATVQAEDKDLNLDGGISYRLVKHPGVINDGIEFFSISKDTGEIFVNARLDYESLGAETNYYTLVITATDSGPGILRTAQTTLKIYVRDDEEHGPVFEYEGCIRFDGYCVRPSYTASSVQKLNQPINVYPVPNTQGKPVDIMFRSRDSNSRATIQTFIVSTLPGGYKDHFEARTVYYPHNKVEIRQTKEIPMQDMAEMEVLLKVEADGRGDMAGYAMVTFVDPDSSAIAGGNTGSPKEGESEPDDKYSELTLTLIIIIAVTLTLVLCLAIVVICLVRRQRREISDKERLYSPKEAYVNDGATAL